MGEISWLAENRLACEEWLLHGVSLDRLLNILCCTCRRLSRWTCSVDIVDMYSTVLTYRCTVRVPVPGSSRVVDLSLHKSANCYRLIAYNLCRSFEFTISRAYTCMVTLRFYVDFFVWPLNRFSLAYSCFTSVWNAGLRYVCSSWFYLVAWNLSVYVFKWTHLCYGCNDYKPWRSRFAAVTLNITGRKTIGWI